ncbi:hypothetical protein POM88_030905 [Heracleum sosnowskyi]|uniref:Pentapeptide repeat-containing protein n=1 Tax=Heracleum sosnowskyi TaxID=360622 RepID=A0AAD8HYC0_9APIA|nr:hypothetical protein POM88_030905 [Heracleum sosnowskyi]
MNQVLVALNDSWKWLQYFWSFMEVAPILLVIIYNGYLISNYRPIHASIVSVSCKVPEGSIFHNATLRECEFTGANLRGALLAGANLQSANLQDACLIDCSFCGADLRSAHLHQLIFDLHQCLLGLRKSWRSILNWSLIQSHCCLRCHRTQMHASARNVVAY